MLFRDVFALNFGYWVTQQGLTVSLLQKCELIIIQLKYNILLLIYLLQMPSGDF